MSTELEKGLDANVPSEKPKNPPVKVFRDGVLVSEIWKNTTEKDNRTIEFYTVSVKRSYKQEDAWKETTSLREADLLNVGHLLALSHSWILEQKQIERDRKANEGK